MKHRLFIVFALLSMLSWGEALAQEITFSYETFSDKGQTIPYRKAVIAGLGDKASLVIYLHGGTSKGDDNELQMQEPGINAISTWFEAKNRKAIMLVPQCPQDQSWVGTMQERIVRLLQSYIDKGLADAKGLYPRGLNGRHGHMEHAFQSSRIFCSRNACSWQSHRTGCCSRFTNAYLYRDGYSG